MTKGALERMTGTTGSAARGSAPYWVAMLLCGLGLAAFPVGFLLQINLMGHGGPTGLQYIGAFLMTAGAGVTAVCGGMAAAFGSPPAKRKIGAAAGLVGLVLWAWTGYSIGASPSSSLGRAARWNKKELQKRIGRHSSLADTIANQMFQEGLYGPLVIARYAARDGGIVEGILVAPPGEDVKKELSVSEGRISRLSWSRGGNPALPRFRFLLTEAGEGAVLRTPYGESALPHPIHPYPHMMKYEFPDQLEDIG